jgi:hypothetical protein
MCLLCDSCTFDAGNRIVLTYFSPRLKALSLERAGGRFEPVILIFLAREHDIYLFVSMKFIFSRRVCRLLKLFSARGFHDLVSCLAELTQSSATSILFP